MSEGVTYNLMYTHLPGPGRSRVASRGTCFFKALGQGLVGGFECGCIIRGDCGLDGGKERILAIHRDVLPRVKVRFSNGKGEVKKERKGRQKGSTHQLEGGCSVTLVFVEGWREHLGEDFGFVAVIGIVVGDERSETRLVVVESNSSRDVRVFVGVVALRSGHC